MAAKYWYKATGADNWATATNWYNGPGGTGGTTSIPTAADDVFLTGLGTLTIAAAATCLSLDCTGFTGTLAGTSTLAFAGNITLGANMTLTYSGTATLGAGMCMFITNGKIVTFNIVVNNASAFLAFESDLTTTTTNSLTLTAGIAGFNGGAYYNISIGSFVSTGAVARILGAYLNLIGTGSVWNVSGTNFGTNSIITITDASASTKSVSHTATTGTGVYDYKGYFNIIGAGTGSYTLTGNFININCWNTGGASISFGTSTISGVLDWGLYGPIGITPNMNWNNGATTVTFNNDSNAIYFNSDMTITASATISVNNPIATTTMVISNVYNKSLTAPITVVGGTSSTGGIYIAEGNLITTSTITLTSGVINYGAYVPGQGSVYCSALSTSNANPRQLVIVDLYLTGSGTLLTATTTTNLSLSIDNIYVSGTASLARTLALNTIFYPNTAVYLAGSGSGSITLAASTSGFFNVYVTNIGGAPVSFSTATINSLIFSPGTNAVWSNSASQTLTIQGNFKIASSVGTPTLTPNIILNGIYASTDLNIDIALGGKALVTGTIVLNQSVDGINFHFLDSFSMNAALNVTFANTVDFTGAFSGTTLTVSKTSEITFNSSLTLSGSITLANDTVFYFNNSLTLRGTTSCTTITHSALGIISVFAPLTATTSIVLNNVNGGIFTSLNGATVTTNAFTITNGLVTLNGNLSCIGPLTLTTGQFIVNGNYNVTASSFISSGTTVRTLVLGKGIWTITSNGNIWNIVSTNLTFNSGTSTINITDSSSVSAIGFIGGSQPYYTLQLNRGTSTTSVTITGSNQFVNFIDLGTATHSLLFTAGTTQTIGNFAVNGTTGAQITLNSTTTAAFTLSKSPAGLVNCDFLNIQHCLATPTTGTWYAGTNSTNNQAVTTAGSGWIFTNIPPRKLGAGGVG